MHVFSITPLLDIINHARYFIAKYSAVSTFFSIISHQKEKERPQEI